MGAASHRHHARNLRPTGHKPSGQIPCQQDQRCAVTQNAKHVGTRAYHELDYNLSSWEFLGLRIISVALGH